MFEYIRIDKVLQEKKAILEKYLHDLTALVANNEKLNTHDICFEPLIKQINERLCTIYQQEQKMIYDHIESRLKDLE